MKQQLEEMTIKEIKQMIIELGERHGVTLTKYSKFNKAELIQFYLDNLTRLEGTDEEVETEEPTKPETDKHDGSLSVVSSYRALQYADKTKKYWKRGWTIATDIKIGIINRGRRYQQQDPNSEPYIPDSLVAGPFNDFNELVEWLEETHSSYAWWAARSLYEGCTIEHGIPEDIDVETMVPKPSKYEKGLGFTEKHYQLVYMM